MHDPGRESDAEWTQVWGKMIRRGKRCSLTDRLELILIHQQVKLIYTKACLHTACVVMLTRRENLCYEANRGLDQGMKQMMGRRDAASL